MLFIFFFLVLSRKIAASLQGVLQSVLIGRAGGKAHPENA
jgi:hypothetical protein